MEIITLWLNWSRKVDICNLIFKSLKPKRLRTTDANNHMQYKFKDWPFNRLQQCLIGVNPSHVVRVETSGTLGPEDLDVSGSVEKGTNNARVRDYIHTLGRAKHCHCQNLRSIPHLAH